MPSRLPSDVCPGRNGIASVPRKALTNVQAYELRGRPTARASVSITAVSAGNSPPFPKSFPFSMDIPRVLSPLSWFKCNGNCPFPTESDIKCAHVVSDDSSTPAPLTLGNRYLYLLAKITSRLMTMFVMELSHRYVMRSLIAEVA